MERGGKRSATPLFVKQPSAIQSAIALLIQSAVAAALCRRTP